MSRGRLRVVGPVGLDYGTAWGLQQRALEARIQGRIDDVLLLVEHPPVVTLGRAADEAHLLVPEAELLARGTRVYRTDRGGDVTWHGPGQLTGYPILDLGRQGRDVHLYLRELEAVLIRTLSDYGLTGERVEGLTGVWVEGAKVAAIGVKLKRWVTMHGFALNVSCTLDGFQAMIPCGLAGRPVTSMLALLGAAPDLGEVAGRLTGHLAARFGLEAEVLDLAGLEALVAPEEQVVLVDAEDREIGLALKLAAHRDGLLHRAFSVFVHDGRGRVLLQRRAEGKYHSAGLWANACCGHPRPGEEIGAAARRRLSEELGIACALQPAGRVTYRVATAEGLVEHELDHVLVGVYEGAVTPDPAEVMEYRWIAADALAREVEAGPGSFAPWVPLVLPGFLSALRPPPPGSGRG